MSKRKFLIEQLAHLNELASGSRFSRLMRNPFKYGLAILIVYLSKIGMKKAYLKKVKTFFGEEMWLRLPSSTDIYLTGGKTHASEIRLASFFIHNLEEGDSFMDVGAHYGFFSLLGASLVGRKGKGFSFEASTTTYEVLKKNERDNLSFLNKAVSEKSGEISFFEFPNRYSEYNTIELDQFENSDWLKANPPREIKIPCVSLDEIIRANDLKPKLIKIDVEGAELEVLKGLSGSLETQKPMVVMEYLSKERGNLPHQQAAAILKTFGYQTFAINENGKTTHLADVDNYFEVSGIDSDNILFKVV